MLARKTVAGALAAATRTLSDAGVDAPAREARLLLAHVLGTTVEKLIGRNDSPLAGDAEARFASGIARRRAREPLAQIVGRREFWSMMISVGPEVLTPRPDSELLVETTLSALSAAGRRNTPLSLLDLGTGSGCLLIALLRELPAARGLGLDASEAALARAQANAQSLGVASRCQFIRGDWTEALGARFDVIISNPPYIASGEIAGLMPEVRAHEPLLALDGGADGLDAYRQLLPTIAGRLAPRGALYLEIGEDQGPAVIDLAQSAGLRLVTRRSDLAGIERCLTFSVAAGPP